MRYFVLGLLALSASVFTFSMTAHAASPIGVASYTHGSVLVKRGEAQAIALNVNDPVFLHDVVMTDEGDHVAVQFIDNTSIEMNGADGSLSIDEYLYDPAKPESNKARFNVLRASFKYVSGLLPKESHDVEIGLDFGSIGVRGTTLSRSMKDGECWIFLEDGAIDVFNEGGTVSLLPGDGTRIGSLTTAPAEVKPWGQKNIDWINSEVARP
jgi:hypothetical protein